MNMLFLRDFDAEQESLASSVTEETEAEPSEPLFTFTESEIGKMLAEARAEGHQQGFQEGEASGQSAERASIEAQCNAALQNLQDQLADFAAQDDRRRGELQQDVVDMFLDIAERLAPEFLRSYSADLVQAKLTEALHLGVGTSALTIKLSPETEAQLSNAITSLAGPDANLTISTEPSFKNGEAQVTWENGFMKYNLDRVCAELLDGLRSASENFKQQPQKV